jgi:hypothetical protein
MKKMKKPNVMKIARDVHKSVDKYTPEILTGLGIAGMISTTVLAVTATPKALKMIEDENNLRAEYALDGEEVKPMTKLEIVKVAWKPYVPAVTLGLASTACLIGANKVSTRRTAALATAYKLAETSLVEYKDAVIETIGEKKEKEVKDNLAKKQIENNPVGNNVVLITGKGNTLCYDAFSGQYFRSDIEKLRKAENALNFKMRSQDYVSLNELYEEIGLTETKMGYELGWNIDGGMIEFYFSAQLTEEDEPCLVLDFNIAPKYEYDKYL